MSSFVQNQSQRLTNEVSPSRVRISQLSERLTNIQLGQHEEKNIKKETFETKIRILDEKINKNAENDEAKFKLFKDSLIKLQEGISNSKLSREILNDRKQKELKLVENNFKIELGKEQQNCRESDAKILKQFEEKNYQVKSDLHREQISREEEEEDCRNLLEGNLQSLRDSIAEERRLREEGTEQLITKFGEDILKLQEMLSYEQKVRQEGQNQIYKMLEEMDDKFTSELHNEKKTRENTEETLLMLLEETCNKIENTLTNQ